jgi:hypothetical protein
MRFYVRKFLDSDTRGPFTVEEIKRMLRAKELCVDSVAISEEEYGAQKTNGWPKLADFPDFHPGVKTPAKYLMLILIVVGFMVIIPIALVIRWAILLSRIH